MNNKVVIFCGGLATRFNNGKPGPLKPLLKVNNKPIIEHIIERYKNLKNPEFILLGGHRYNELKKFQKKISKKFNVISINTGKFTNTGGRLLKIKNYIKNDFFYLTYGDTITDYKPNILKKNKNSQICLYKYKVPYGVIEKNVIVKKMYEKNFFIDVNAGHYYLDPKILKYLKNNNQSFEKEILPQVIRKKKIKFDYLFLKKWIPIDNQTDLKKAKQQL
jgi:glucose-1-phosphate cytidylyltransferase